MTTVANELPILAPLSGILVPLSTIPDPVFANKMVGDGVSLDPTSDTLLAPVAGTVVQLHRARHALTIRTTDGIDILIHIGLDTVALKGEGFTPMVREGDGVVVGQPLITFDLDRVGRSARALLTEIIVAEGAHVRRVIPATGPVEAGKSVAMTLVIEGKAAVRSNAAVDAAAVVSAEVALPNPAGLHARPAAVLAAAAKAFTSDIRLKRGADEANAKSVVAIMGLSTRQGDRVAVRAAGPDAARAAATLEKLLAEGCGEAADAAPASAAPPPPAPKAAVSTDPRDLAGVSASPGFAVGRVFRLTRDEIAVPEFGVGVEEELDRLDSALKTARDQIDGLRTGIPADKAKILDAHKELLSDPDLLDAARDGVRSGKSAGFAWRAAFTGQAATLAKLDNPLLRERADDVRDVGTRALRVLAGVTESRVQAPADAILIAEDLTPSDLAAIDRTRVLGFCTVGGGATSHVAIIARSLALPAVVGIDPAALAVENGALVVLDADKGFLRREPTPDELSAARDRLAALALRRESERAAAHDAARTTDGHAVEVVANIRNAADARDAIAAGADGVGLLRSEFLFDDRPDAPGEDEQAAAYLAVAEVLGPNRPLVIRTLDVGGDKPLAYLPLPKEDNPFLGLRGIRVGLERPDLLRTQLRAILRTADVSNLHIMFPMIASIDELREAKAVAAEESASLGKTAKIGVMIEVPAAAVMAEILAAEADFFSIGTNDLTQYVLAMDRGHAKLAKRADALHPAVLRMIKMTVDGAHARGKWVGVCGGLASEPIAVPALIGLGVDELSVSAPAVASVKAAVRAVSLADCRDIAGRALALGTAAEVRALLGSVVR